MVEDAAHQDSSQHQGDEGLVDQRRRQRQQKTQLPQQAPLAAQAQV
ncbi:MAG: hypothetical protein M0C28_06555 [Candidatus Moduliflexus flocculans]|nr:hypothetical protein [Candidatus Moduliflexus flocculans]